VSTVETADDFDAVTVGVVVVVIVVVIVVVVVVVAFWECRQVGNRTFISRLSRKYRPIARPLAAAKTQAMLQ
jgi:FtsZ-interacting cell division protein ZipA